RAGDNGRPEPRNDRCARPAMCNHTMLLDKGRRRIHIPPSQKKKVMSKATVEPLRMHRLRNDNRPPAREPAASESSTSTPAVPDPPGSPSRVRSGVRRTVPRQNIQMPASDHEVSGSVGAAQ